MSSEFHIAEQPRYFLRLNATAAGETSHDLAPLLGQLAGEGGADGVVIYRFDVTTSEFTAVAAQSSVEPRIPTLGVTLSAEASTWLRRNRDPLQVTAATDARFASLPEGLQYGFRRLILIPLRAGDTVLGFVTLGKQKDEEFEGHQVRGAARIARVVGAVLERDALQVQLKERKVVERAKGILQQKRKLSEESAYIFLRETSRRLRMPMAEVARDVIASAAFRSAGTA